MQTVRQLLGGKAASHVWSLSPEQTVIEALELMATRNIGAVLILRGDQLVGIFSERDYARKGVLQGRVAHTTPIADVMTAAVITVSPDQNIDDCMMLFRDKKIRHLPVVETERVVGLLSIGDIVNAIIQEQEGHIKNLEQYISGY